MCRIPRRPGTEGKEDSQNCRDKNFREARVGEVKRGLSRKSIPLGDPDPEVSRPGQGLSYYKVDPATLAQDTWEAEGRSRSPFLKGVCF